MSSAEKQMPLVLVVRQANGILFRMRYERMNDNLPEELVRVADEFIEPNFADEVIITPYKGYVVAEYLPLGITIEGEHERAARDELMSILWKKIAKILEARLQTFERDFSVRNMIQIIEGDYYSKNERPIRVREEKVGVIEIELTGKDE